MFPESEASSFGKVYLTQLELWLALHQQRLKKSSVNEYIRFLRDLFAIAFKMRAISDSPAAALSELKRERPIRQSPTWEQFQAQASCLRLKSPRFSPRSLRRWLITRAIELGVDFKTIASWQGHQDGGVLIAKIQSHLRNEHSDAMARKLTI